VSPKRRNVLLAVGLPAAVGTTSSLLLRPEWATLAAPVLGPWAGVPLGHDECTMARALPGWSLGSIGLGLLALGSTLLLRSPRWRPVAITLLGAWSSAWSGLALLSVLNTCS
jgi:hypothetical protein